MRWGDVATWVQAVGTVAAFWIAFWQIRTERRARQAGEHVQRERDHRSQAERVSAWYGGQELPPDADYDSQDTTVISVLNRSDEPVYEAVITMVYIQGAAPHTGEAWSEIAPQDAPREVWAVLPPGERRVTMPGGWGILTGRVGAEIAFTDRAGASWVRRATGALEELPTDAIDHYAISRPLDYKPPIRS